MTNEDRKEERDRLERMALLAEVVGAFAVVVSMNPSFEPDTAPQ